MARHRPVKHAGHEVMAVARGSSRTHYHLRRRILIIFGTTAVFAVICTLLVYLVEHKAHRHRNPQSLGLVHLHDLAAPHRLLGRQPVDRPRQDPRAGLRPLGDHRRRLPRGLLRRLLPRPQQRDERRDGEGRGSAEAEGPGRARGAAGRRRRYATRSVTSKRPSLVGMKAAVRRGVALPGRRVSRRSSVGVPRRAAGRFDLEQDERPDRAARLARGERLPARVDLLAQPLRAGAVDEGRLAAPPEVEGQARVVVGGERTRQRRARARAFGRDVAAAGQQGEAVVLGAAGLAARSRVDPASRARRRPRPRRGSPGRRPAPRSVRAPRRARQLDRRDHRDQHQRQHDDDPLGRPAQPRDDADHDQETRATTSGSAVSTSSLLLTAVSRWSRAMQ